MCLCGRNNSHDGGVVEEFWKGGRIDGCTGTKGNDSYLEGVAGKGGV